MLSLYLATLLLSCPTVWSLRPKPQFSWDTVPVFQHLASVNGTFSQPFPGPRLHWLASSYPLVVLEHAQGQGHWAYTLPNSTGSQWGPAPFSPPSGLIEDHFIAAAGALKALNSSLIVLYYQQITGALPYYRASQVANAHPEWTLDASCNPRSGGISDGALQGGAPSVGDILPNYATWGWDHTQDGVTQNFVANFLNVSSHSLLDGTFIDTASCYNSGTQASASLATVQAMQLAAPDKIVGFHTESSLSGANGFSAAMDYTFAQPNAKARGGRGAKDTSCQAGLDWLSANGEAGVLSLAHIGDVDQGPDYTYSLACYLAGANEMSYFAFSAANKTEDAWRQCWDGGSPTYPVFPTWCSGQGWSADFARPLGTPTGPATPTGGKRGEVTRSFASGTKVTIEAKGAACSIAWADGHTTTCQ